MESLAEAEKETGHKIKTPVPVKEHAWSPITYDFSAVQLGDSDDILDEGAEDREIMASLASAEKSMGKTMKTPTAFKEHPWSPLKYDVEEVQLDS